MHNFNRITPIYDLLKKLVFNNQLDEAAAYYVEKIPKHSQILIIGGGSGQLLSHFHSSQNISFVEISEKMIRLAKKRERSAEIEFFTSNIMNFHSNKCFDVVITPFFLDCFKSKDLIHIFLHIDKFLKIGGLWLHSDFYPQNKNQQLMVRFMYYCFRLSTGLKVDKIPNFNNLFTSEKFIQEKKVALRNAMVHSYIYRKIA